jgi:hypothetical protein
MFFGWQVIWHMGISGHILSHDDAIVHSVGMMGRDIDSLTGLLIELDSDHSRGEGRLKWRSATVSLGKGVKGRGSC